MSLDDDKDRPADPDGPVLPMDDSGPVDLSDLRAIDIAPILVFWVLAGVVFLQFFSRYVMNDSIGWTEEIARYLLIGVTFTGAMIAARKDTHIQVEFFYRWLPMGARKAMATLVDAGKLAFYLAATWFTVQLAMRTRQKMASIEVSKAVIYWVVAGCFAVMALYSLILLVRRLRRGGGGGPLVETGAHAGMERID